MIIERQDIDYCKSRLKVKYEKDKVDEAVNAIVKEVSKKFKVSGFRNKAPADAVKVAAYKLIIGELKDKLLTEAVEDAIFEYKWKLFGNPLVEKVDATYSNFEAEIVFGYKPEFTLNKYSDFELKTPPVSSAEFYADKLLENILDEAATQQPYTEDDFLLAGDNAVINFYGFIDGQPFEGSCGESVVLEIGKSGTLPGFEDNLMGMRPDETREFDLVVDENTENKTIAGKTISFIVKLLSASKKVVPELSQEIANSKGFASLEELSKWIETQALTLRQETIFGSCKQELIEKLNEVNEVVIPDWVVIDVANNALAAQGKKLQELNDQQRMELIQLCRGRIKVSLILEKIKDLEPTAQLADEELKRLLELNLPRFPEHLQNALLVQRDVNTYAQVLSDIQNEFTVKWVFDHSRLLDM